MTRSRFLIAACLVFFAAPVQAAEGTPAVDGPQTLLDMIVASGWMGIAFMVVLGLFSLVGVAVIIERLVNLTRRKLLPPAFVTELAQLTREAEDDPDRFRALCEKHPSPAASILRAGVLRAGRPVTEVEKAMEDAAAREAAALRSWVRPLNVIGSVAPLVGLLGTVVGMILAFRTASQVGLGGKAELLAEGIYLALLTTAAGLTIAIPVMLAAAYFNTRIDRFLREIDERLMEAIPCFALMEREPPRPATERTPLETVER